MREPEPLEIKQAPVASFQLPRHGRVEAMMLARETAERLHHRDIADDVRHFAVNLRGFVGEITMQRFACGGDVENCGDHAARNRSE